MVLKLMCLCQRNQMLTAQLQHHRYACLHGIACLSDQLNGRWGIVYVSLCFCAWLCLWANIVVLQIASIFLNFVSEHSSEQSRHIIKVVPACDTAA